MKTNKIEARLRKMEEMGIDTSKFMVANTLDGRKAIVDISENQLRIVYETESMECEIGDEHKMILDNIRKSGFVKNPKLFRRWVMAQTFRIIKSEMSYETYVYNRMSDKYMWTMLLDELKTLAKLQKEDPEYFKERATFFSPQTVCQIINDYKEQFENYILYKMTTCNSRCKGREYIRIGGGRRSAYKMEIFSDRVYAELMQPMDIAAKSCLWAANDCNYELLYECVKRFVKQFVFNPNVSENRLLVRDKKFKISKAWFNAYKGNGAYYTMQNMIMFHNCYIHDEYGRKLSTIESLEYISSKLEEYKGEGWKYVAMMRKLIKDNNFTF